MAKRQPYSRWPDDLKQKALATRTTQAHIRDLERQLAESWEEIRKEFAQRASVLLELPAENLVPEFVWDCPGPLGVCVYADDDTSQDECLFCHDPIERK